MERGKVWAKQEDLLTLDFGLLHRCEEAEEKREKVNRS